MNRFPAFISAVSVCMIVSGAYGLAGDAAATKPDDDGFKPTVRQKFLQDAIILEMWNTDKGLSDLVALPTEKKDAAPLYAKMADLYVDRLGKAAEKGELFDKEDTEKIAEWALAASDCAECSLTPTVIEPVTTFMRDTDGKVNVFPVVASLLTARARELERNGTFAEAERYLRACMIMGWHLTETRPNLLVLSMGLSIQAETADAFEQYLLRQLQRARAKKAYAYRRFLKRLVARVGLKSRFHLSKWMEFDSLLAAVDCALKDEDPFWRQQAVRHLAVMRNGAPTSDGVFHKDPVQQKMAEDALIAVSEKDPVESIRKLAAWCLENVDENEIERIRKEAEAADASP